MFARGDKLTRKHASAATTIVGPEGVSHVREPNNPPITDADPISPEITTICSGLLENRRAAAAGMISIAVMRSTPIISIDIAITHAIRKTKMILARSGFIPSAFAISRSTVAANNGRQIIASAIRAVRPPI